jgi:dynactin complex subunit
VCHVVRRLDSTLKQERDELKDECEDLRSSNTRMGEKIAELALLKGQLDQENASLKSTVLQNENELSNVKNSLRDKEKAVEK